MCAFKWRDIIIIGGMRARCKMHAGGDDAPPIAREKLSCNEKPTSPYLEANSASTRLTRKTAVSPLPRLVFLLGISRIEYQAL